MKKIPPIDFLELLQEFVSSIEGNYDCSDIDQLMVPLKILLSLEITYDMEYPFF